MTTELIILCLRVFLCRVVDVSCSTFRTVLLVKGKTTFAALIAIFEAFIWFWIVRDALNFETTNILEKINIALAYASGFSIGNVIGGLLAKKISGTINVQVVTSAKDTDLIKKIQEKGFEVTVTVAEASQYSGEKFVIFAAIDNKRLNEFKSLIKESDDKAFIMASETKIVRQTFVK